MRVVVCCYCSRPFVVTAPPDAREGESALTEALIDSGLELECGRCRPPSTYTGKGPIHSEDDGQDYPSGPAGIVRFG